MEQVIRSALGRFAKPAAPSKSALVIVDMNNDRKGILPNRGCLETGIHRVVEVISAARRMCIPVLLVTLPEYPYIMQELLEAAGPSPRTMVKIYRSCFLDPEFAEIINQFAIGTLILGERSETNVSWQLQSMRCNAGLRS